MIGALEPWAAHASFVHESRYGDAAIEQVNDFAEVGQHASLSAGPSLPRRRRHSRRGHRRPRWLPSLYLPAATGTCPARPSQLARVPQLEGLPGIDGYAAELGLASELSAAIGQYQGTWIEYGVAEHAYAMRRAADFAEIVAQYGYKAIAPQRYTASAFLTGVLGVMSRHSTVIYPSIILDQRAGAIHITKE